METEEEITKRIQSLRSKQKDSGPFRAAGIQQSINSYKEKLKAIKANKLEE
jgi:hypothetical protein